MRITLISIGQLGMRASLVALVGILFAITPSLLFAANTGESLVMPGALIEGHAKYEGECKNCHKPFDKQAQRGLCLDCHKKIRGDIEAKHKFHGKPGNVGESQCIVCHTEHKGRKADIVKLDRQNFDHRKTEFALKGKHSNAPCASCHKPREKFRLAPKDCYACHKKDDTHKNRLGKECQKCHTEATWKKTRFDHDKTKFKLTGKHQTIACENCHANQHFKNIPDQCIACHKINDVHKGQLGDACVDCHSTKNWKALAFDHDLETDFPLEGKHKNLKCQSCHKKDPREEELEQTCYSCHRYDDSHRGRYSATCEKCHTATAWTKTTFQHNKDTKFTLKGKHEKASCTDCHKTTLYKTKTPTRCFDCHKNDDTHKGTQGKDCAKCHVEQGWKEKIAFDHGFTKFPLVGLHVVVPCKQCHVNAQYKKTPGQCIECHEKKDEHKGKLGGLCHECHNPNSWKIWIFDHTKQTKYPLKGAHAKTHCHSCHKKASRGKVPQLSKECVHCHLGDDAHNGNFGSDCARCHDLNSFRNIIRY